MQVVDGAAERRDPRHQRRLVIVLVDHDEVVALRGHLEPIQMFGDQVGIEAVGGVVAAHPTHLREPLHCRYNAGVHTHDVGVFG